MSTTFVIRCDDHRVSGPMLRRGGAVMFTPAGPWSESWRDDAVDQWHEFLVAHEWCHLRLLHETAVDSDWQPKACTHDWQATKVSFLGVTWTCYNCQEHKTIPEGDRP